MESKYLFDFGATNFPPIKSSYLAFSLGSAVSGAGSYSHRSPKISCGTALDPVALVTGLVDVMSVALRGLSEVVRRLVGASLFLLDLPQQVIQQRTRSKAVARQIQPRIAERLLDGDKIVQGLLGAPDAARRLHPDRNTRRQIKVANRFDHHLRVGERRATRSLAGARLDEVAGSNRLHRKKGGSANVVVGVELADFENHFQRCIATSFDDGADLVLYGGEFAGKKKPAIDDHVDLVGAVCNRRSDFLESQRQWTLSRRE